MEKVFLHACFALLTLGLCGLPNPFRKVARKVDEAPSRVEPRPIRSPRDIAFEDLRKVNVSSFHDGEFGPEREVTDREGMRALVEAFRTAQPATSQPGQPRFRIRLLLLNGDIEEIECHDSVLVWRNGIFLMPDRLSELLKKFK